MSDKKTKLAQGDDRSQKAVRVAAPGRTQRALQAGAHSDAVHPDGSSQADTNKHKRIDGGSPGPDGTKYKTITEKK
jgi:hypothetical protein